MRYLLTIIISVLLISAGAKAQTSELPVIVNNTYPRYITDSPGNVACVIFTVEQARKIDNDEDLLRVYKELNKGSDSVINALVIKVKLADTVITIMKLKVTELEKINSQQKVVTAELKNIIELYKTNVELANQQLGKKDEQIKNLEGQVRKQKGLKIAGFSVGAGVIILAVLGIL